MYGLIKLVPGLALACSLPAQEVDPERARAELVEALARPEGTRIGDENRARLAAFLERYEGQDLGPVSYAPAIHDYLNRRYDEAAMSLDRFFERFDRIDDSEHAMMAGRIYLNGFVRATRAGDVDPELLARYAERVARLYPDARVVETTLVSRLVSLGERAQRTVRLGVARGVLASALTPADQEQILRSLFGGGDIPAVEPPGRRRSDRAKEAEAGRDALVGRVAPDLEAEHVLGAGSDFTLADARGKVVVLDFCATWCGPCRGVIPRLLALQAKHPEHLQVVGVTRFYGYGTDFAGGKDAGEIKRGLDRAAEIAINERFVEAFGIGYPMVFVRESVFTEAYGVLGIPTLFVIGRDGGVVGHAVGAGDEAHQEIERLVERALDTQ